MSDLRITKDVVLDLLPAVRAGTASADSQALVESFLAENPELAASADLLPFPSAELEMEALRRTRRRLRRHGWMLGLAIFLTALPLSFMLDAQGAHFVFADQLPSALLSLAAAGGAWLWVWKHGHHAGKA